MMAGDQKFKDACKACYSMVWTNRPMVLGASLTSLEPEPSVRLYFVRGWLGKCLRAGIQSSGSVDKSMRWY